MNWHHALDGYWLEKRRDLSLHTIADYTTTYTKFGAYVGELDLAAITPGHVRRFLNDLADAGLAPKTIANAWIALSSFWSWAEHELGIPHIIRGKVARPRWRRPDIAPYTQAEIQAMIAQCAEGPAWTTRGGRQARSKRPTAARDRALLIILVDTGLRVQELCDLTIADYQPKTGALRVRHGKGDKPRTVYLCDAGRRALWRYLAERADVQPADPLLATSHNTHLTRRNVLRLVQIIAGRAAVDGATVHRFRHTFAITFLRNGGSVLALQALLGHEQMATIRIYARLADIDLAGAHQSASPADRWRL